MAKNIKFFGVSGSTLEYRELRLFRTKVLGAGLLIGFLTVCVILVVNHIFGDPLGFGYNEMSLLTQENRKLKEQLRQLSNKMENVQSSLDDLAERGNELRLMVDLARIDEDTREVSVGGSTALADFSAVSGEMGEILASSHQLIDKLLREVKLQQTSYEEIYKRYTYNKKYFAHLPAIKPMEGYYSINGFGMRVHPILRVYRMHEGVDIINDVGTNVYATGDGLVRYAGRTQGGYGAVIELSHGFGHSTLYAHLSRVYVRPGQTVKRGELIAKSGRSGLVSGPHLHYEVRYKGRKQNPVDYFFDDVDAARYRAQLARIDDR